MNDQTRTMQIIFFLTVIWDDHRISAANTECNGYVDPNKFKDNIWQPKYALSS